MTEVRQGKRKEKDVPAVVTAVVNRRTGEIFFGDSGKRPDVKNPVLLDAMPKKSLVENGRPPNHCTEPDAINKALAKRGTRMEDLEVYSVETRTGKRKKPCENCIKTTADTFHR